MNEHILFPSFFGVLILGSHVATVWLWFTLTTSSTLNAYSENHCITSESTRMALSLLNQRIQDEPSFSDDYRSSVDEILHIKCPIIRLVECQMSHMESRFASISSRCKRRRSWAYRIWKQRWVIISTILMVFLMVSLFLYGTLVGAGMCSSGQWQYSFNSPCPKTFSFLPGLNLAGSTPILTY